MKMLLVKSEAIKEIGYNHQTNRLDIKFNHEDDQSKKYRFCNVPWYVFNGFLQATSKGKYYDSHIREKYRCLMP